MMLKVKKIRVSGILTQGPMVRSWGAIPIAMGWGEVPSSLQSGVIDAALTTVGAWRSVQDIAPFYTVLGVGGVFTDFDIVMASKKWWDGLSKVQQDALKGVIEKFVDEFAYWQNSEDQLGYKAFGTIDPKKPGIYIAKEDEIAPFRDAVGNKMAENLIKELGEEIRPWAEGFIKEGVEISQKWPTGSHPCEKIDFEEYRSKINMK
jgi:TRAP-type C4-dicarboxylate transport system substrate-binding protein